MALVALCAAVAQGFGRFSYALLLPAIDRDLLGSYALAGLLATLNVGAYLVGALAVSALARRVDPVTLLRTGLVASTLGLGLLARADGAAQVGAGLALTGVGGAFIWLPGPGLAGSVVPLERRGAAIGLSGSGVGLGIVVASALAAGLQRLQGDGFWRSVWLVETSISLLALVLCLLLLRPAATSTGATAVRTRALRRVPGWAGAALTFGLVMSGLPTVMAAPSGSHRRPLQPTPARNRGWGWAGATRAATCAAQRGVHHRSSFPDC